MPSRKKIAFTFVASSPAFLITCLLFQKSLDKSSLAFFGAGLFFFVLGWWFPIRILKRRERAIELNAWEPKVLKRTLKKEPKSELDKKVEVSRNPEKIGENNLLNVEAHEAEEIEIEQD